IATPRRAFDRSARPAAAWSAEAYWPNALSLRQKLHHHHVVDIAVRQFEDVFFHAAGCKAEALVKPDGALVGDVGAEHDVLESRPPGFFQQQFDHAARRALPPRFRRHIDTPDFSLMLYFQSFIAI